jgi:hypothetical protein
LRKQFRNSKQAQAKELLSRTHKTPTSHVKAEEILAVLPKRVPYTWGAEANELVRKVQEKCLQPI